jgi:hypothetical protein
MIETSGSGMVGIKRHMAALMLKYFNAPDQGFARIRDATVSEKGGAMSPSGRGQEWSERGGRGDVQHQFGVAGIIWATTRGSPGIASTSGRCGRRLRLEVLVLVDSMDGDAPITPSRSMRLPPPRCAPAGAIAVPQSAAPAPPGRPPKASISVRPHCTSGSGRLRRVP